MSTPNYAESKDRARPVVECTVKNRAVQALVDTGASITVMAETEFRKIWNNWTIQRLPMPSHLRVSGITGQQINFTDYVSMELEVLGRKIIRPVLIVSGLDHTRLVIGYDTIKEEGIVIDGKNDSISWSESPTEENWARAALCALRSTEIEPKTVAKIVVQPRMGAKTLQGGVMGVCSSAHGSPLLLWDSLVSTDDHGRITLAIANHQIHSVKIKPNDCIGFIHNETFQEAETKERTDEFIHSFFGDFGTEPPEPKKGELQPATEAEREYLLSKMHIKAPSEWRQRYIDLMLRYHDTMSKNKFDLGWSDVVKHKIRMKTEEPIFVRQFRVPMHHHEVLKEFVNELLRKGAIRPSRSPYNSPIFCVDKKMPHDAKPGDKPPLRTVLDFRTINLNSMPDRYSMRDVRECLDEVGLESSNVYSAVDLTSGFWQQSLDEESRQYTAFTAPGTSGGTKYEFCVTPMGLAGSPSSFARMILYILRGVDNLICYVDDVLAHNKGHEAHLKTLEELMLRFRKYGLKINVDKTIFAAAEVQYLGYTLRDGKISPSKDKAEAVKNFPEPRSPRSIREFVGLTNYFRNLVENYARKAAPLIRLTTAAAKWDGGELDAKARAAFLELKKDLATEPVITLPKKDRAFIIYTDAALGDRNNPGGLGAMLVQVDELGTEHTISFASRALKQHEKNYSAYLLEKAGVVWAIDYWSYYLIGQRFTVRSDHRPLETLGSVHKKTLDRLTEQMLEYDFAIEYKEGKLNVVADALSRNAVICSLWAADEDEHSIEVAQREDDETTMIREYLLNKKLPEDTKDRDRTKGIAQHCSMEAGLVWHTPTRKGFRNKKLLFVPKIMRKQIMDDAHARPEAGHGGRHRTSERCRLSFWWPNMDNDCAEMVRHCETCQLARAKREPPANLQPLPRALYPNNRVHIDLFGELRTTESGKRYICVITDAYTKWTEVVGIADKSAETIARALMERWLVRFSGMDILVSDQGKEFCNQIVSEVCKIWSIDKRRTSPFHPETNAQAEVFNKSIINYMRAMLNNHSTLEWETILPMMQLSYNCHVHRATRETPFFLTYGRDPRLPYLSLAKRVPTYTENYAGAQMRALSDAHKRASKNMAEAEDIRVRYFNKMTKERNFAPGERVMVHFPNVKPNVNQKFIKRWRLYQVIKMVGPVNLKLRPWGNAGQNKNILVHVNRVKHANQEEIRQEFDTQNTKTEEVEEAEHGSSDTEPTDDAEERQQPRYYGRDGEQGRDGDGHAQGADEPEQEARQPSQHEGQSENAPESQQSGNAPQTQQSPQLPQAQVAENQGQTRVPVQSGSGRSAPGGESQAEADEDEDPAELSRNPDSQSGPRTCQLTKTSTGISCSKKRSNPTSSTKRGSANPTSSTKRGADPSLRRSRGEDLGQPHLSGTMTERDLSPESFFRQQERDHATKEILNPEGTKTKFHPEGTTTKFHGWRPEEVSSKSQDIHPSHPTRPPPSTTRTATTNPPDELRSSTTSTPQTTTTSQDELKSRMTTSHDLSRTTTPTTRQLEPTPQVQGVRKKEAETKATGKGAAAGKPSQSRICPSTNSSNSTDSSRREPRQSQTGTSTAAAGTKKGRDLFTGGIQLPARRSRRLQKEEPGEDQENKVHVPRKPLEYMSLEEAREELKRVQGTAPAPRQGAAPRSRR